MRPAWALVALVGAFALAESRGESEPVKLTRGGLVTKTGSYRFEVYFYRTGMRVFPERSEGTPLAVSGLTGTAKFYHPNSPKPWFSRPLHAAPSASSLDLAIGLDNVPAAGVKVIIAVDGLPEPSEPMATFTVPFVFVAPSVSRDATAVARPRGGVSSAPYDASGQGSLGFGRYSSLGPGPSQTTGLGSPASIGSPPSPFSYGRSPAVGPGPTLPYVSGHEVLIMPASGGDPLSSDLNRSLLSGAARGSGYRDSSNGWDVPLARPWLKPVD